MSQRCDISGYLFSSSTGYESAKDVGKQHCRIVLGCAYCLVDTGGKDSVESVCMFDENTGHNAFQPCPGMCFQWAAVRWPRAQSLLALGLPGLPLAAEIFFFRSVTLFFRPRAVARRDSLTRRTRRCFGIRNQPDLALSGH